MYRVLPLLGDIGLAILVVVFVSVFQDHSPSMWAWLCVPLIFFPDIDALVEFLARGNVAASKEHPFDHREILHKPLVFMWIPILLWPLNSYMSAIVFFIVLIHFLHDSVLTGWGVSWFWPFTKRRIKFFVNERNENSFARKDWIRSWDEKELQEAIVKYGYEDWIERLYFQPSVVRTIEFSIFGFSLIVLVWFLLA